MRVILFMLLVVGAANAQTLTAYHGSDHVRLTEEPCTNPEVLKHINESVHHLFRAGTGTVDGVEYANCWRKAGQIAFLVYADGDKGTVPWHMLKPAL